MKASQTHVPSLLSAILFALGALVLFGFALLMLLGVLGSVFTGAEIQTGPAIFMLAFGFEAVVLLAAAFFALQKYMQKPSADQGLSIQVPNWLIVTLAVVAGACMLLGYEIRAATMLDWLLLPILTIPVVVLPLILLVAIAARKLPFGTRWQTWNVVGLGMTLTPLLLLFLEVFVGLFIFLGIVVYAMAQPELVSRLQALSQRITALGPQSPAAIALLAPYLTKPGVVVTALIYMAILVPAIEEMFKPVGVWFFARKLASPAQGFTLGALSGAAYALIETTAVSGQTADWASLLFTRMGTGLLHVTTSALMGAAIVAVWQSRRYSHFLGTYLFAVLLHGLWNTAAILFSFSALAQAAGQGGTLSTIQPALIAGMIVLAVVLSTVLVTSNRRMRASLPPPAVPQAPSGDGTDIGQTM